MGEKRQQNNSVVFLCLCVFFQLHDDQQTYIRDDEQRLQRQQGQE